MNRVSSLQAIVLYTLSALLFCTLAVAAENPVRGTIENLDQDNGSITISGVTLGYSDEITQVFLEDQQMESQNLDTGMVVSYISNANGMLVRINLLGPAEKLMLLNQH